MVVVLVLGILLAIAMPSLVSARETGRAKACIANLYQINSAKIQCMMDNKLSATSTATFSIDGVTATTPGPNGTYQLTRTGSNPNYIRVLPACPVEGNLCARRCQHRADVQHLRLILRPSVDYQVGGKWYHGY